MTEIYEVSAPAERAEELLKWMSGKGVSDAAINAFRDAISRGAFSTVLEGLLDESALRAASDEEVEGAFTLIFSLLSCVTQAERQSLIKKLVDAIAIPSEGKSATVRLRILASLYNNLKENTEKASKLEVLRRMITFATDCKQLDLLQNALHAIPKWNLSQEEAATLYLQLSTCYQRLGSVDEEQHFLIQYLSTFEGVKPGSDALAAATHAARSAAINYLKSPAGSQKYHVPRLQAVRALATHPQHSRLYELVDIFAHKDLAAFHAWVATKSSGAAENNNNNNSAYLAEQGIDHAKSVETMRLLTLCSLASAKKDKLLGYDAVSAALQCPVSEVESWVVKAITSGLVDARIDQLGQQIVVSRTTQRVFDAAAWKNLQGSLQQWRGAVSQLLRSTEDAGSGPSR